MKKHHPIFTLFSRFIFFAVRVILALRYRVKLKGTDILKESEAPLLFLPNHQAIVDPMLFMTQVYKHTTCVPVVTSGYYDLPVAKILFKKWGAIRVSDLEKGSRNIKVLDNITSSVTKGFELGHNIVIYPAGQLPSQGLEKIYNKQGAKKIVENLPDGVKVIGVRISGLWGSVWSKAWTGKSPDFTATLLKSIWYTIANLIIFMPRRYVTIEFVDITKEALARAQSDRQTFNSYLEDFYNINGEEKPLFLKHFFYVPISKKELPGNIKSEYEERESSTSTHTFPVDVVAAIKDIVAGILDISTDKIELNSSLYLDLGADSLNLVEFITEIENHFPGYTTPEINSIKTVADLCRIATGQLGKQVKLKPSHLNIPISNISRLTVDKEKNILWQFLDTFTKNKNDWFVYDNMLGSTNRKDFLLKSIVISDVIKRRIKNKHVGIMLPALQSTTMLVIATYMAGKIPVMLNWTVGKSVLEHNIEVAGVEKILTAGSFTERIEEQLPHSIKDKLILLEKEIPGIKIHHKLSALIKSFVPKLFINYKKTDPTAVILFTSGSEAMPKAVPLSHANIVNNLWGVLTMENIDNNRIFLGILPPFHSFGFTVMTILPLLTGIKVAYSPNPTDGKEVMNILKHTGSNILVVTPGFLKLMMAQAAAYHFKTVKFVISGAEAITKQTIERFNSLAPDATVLEGYGITECSPVLTLNPQDKQKFNSVGKFLPGIEGIVVDIDTYKLLPDGKEGMILAKGRNIFSGYLGEANLKPFVTIDGEEYYRTGDLGYIDDEGYLYITGRLKRFIKIAGEMISLPFIERKLVEKYGEDGENVLAVEGSDKTTPPQIVVFTTKEIDKQEAQSYLHKNGVAPIAKITAIVAIDEIPVLGTGKTDYKVLKAGYF